MLASGVGQSYQADGTPAESHPLFRPHPMQGWSPDFIPRLTGDAIEGGLIDAIQPVGGAEALRLARELARQEGIFCGISAGATLAAALEVAKTAPKGSRILFMVPDTGERYLSTPLFEAIGQEMDAEELAISNSTPLCRFGAPAPQPAAAPRSAGRAGAGSGPRLRRAGDRRPRAAGGDVRAGMVRVLLGGAPVPEGHGRAVPLGRPRLGRDAGRAASAATSARTCATRTGEATIPQIFIGGIHVGGAVDVLARHDRGELEPLLRGAGVVPTGDGAIVARSYLPKWLASRSAA